MSLEIFPEMFTPPEVSFDLPETFEGTFADKKVGQKVRAIVSYEVVEKTKSFAMLRITSIYPKPTKRIFT